MKLRNFSGAKTQSIFADGEATGTGITPCSDTGLESTICIGVEGAKWIGILPYYFGAAANYAVAGISLWGRYSNSPAGVSFNEKICSGYVGWSATVDGSEFDVVGFDKVTGVSFGLEGPPPNDTMFPPGTIASSGSGGDTIYFYPNKNCVPVMLRLQKATSTKPNYFLNNLLAETPLDGTSRVVTDLYSNHNDGAATSKTHMMYFPVAMFDQIQVATTSSSITGTTTSVAYQLITD